MKNSNSKQSTLIWKELFEQRIAKKMDEMEDNVPIGLKRKACKKTAEEKRTADVNALQWYFLIRSILKRNQIYIGNS